MKVFPEKRREVVCVCPHHFPSFSEIQFKFLSATYLRTNCIRKGEDKKLQSSTGFYRRSKGGCYCLGCEVFGILKVGGCKSPPTFKILVSFTVFPVEPERFKALLGFLRQRPSLPIFQTPVEGDKCLLRRIRSFCPGT